MALEAKVAALRIRMDDGEADADADDVGADGDTMTIAQALQSSESELVAMKQKRVDDAAMCATPCLYSEFAM